MLRGGVVGFLGFAVVPMYLARPRDRHSAVEIGLQ
jgi:hypothetical protein